MPTFKTKVFLTVLYGLTLIACNGSGTSEFPQNDNTPNETLVDQALFGRDWTLETISDELGNYRPLPLDAIFRLRFETDGRISGNALCNAGSGNWQANDTTLSIVNWTQTEIDCEFSELISVEIDGTVSQLFNGGIMMPTIKSGRLFFQSNNNTQLVFSGRSIRANEQPVRIESLVRTSGGSRASNDNPVFGDLETPYIVYRDIESLRNDYALLPPEEIPWPELPAIDFSNGIVIGAYLPLDSNISSDIFVRNAKVVDTGLEIEVAYYGPNVPDEGPTSNCVVADALSAPWTLVRIESVVEPVIFAETARAFCSGIPTPAP